MSLALHVSPLSPAIVHASLTRPVLLLAPTMSALIFFGFFALTSGHRKITQKDSVGDAPPVKTYHFHYTTSIQCANHVALPANLRIYSSASDHLLADDTVAFVIAKAFVPANDVVLLDAYHIVDVPGNPRDDAYQDSVPDVPIPFVVGVGEVIRTDESFRGDGKPMAFSVSVSEYVRDGPKTSVVQ